MEAECGTSLPDDILLEILSCLGGARALARCRCVCKSWRTLVDAHGLLLLPRALSRDAFFPGFFANTAHYLDPDPLFLSPPSTLLAPEVDMLDFLRPHLPLASSGATVRDHCNGLVLCFQLDDGFVCNPATKRWARLLHPPTALPRDEGLYLAFDPAVSRHYQLFLLPAAPAPKLPVRGAMIILGMIIPGSDGDQQRERLFITKRERDEKAVPVLVFSSEDGRWTRRVFAAGRCSPGHLYDRVMAPDQQARTWRSAAYRHGSLYVQSDSRVLVVLRCLEGTYDMVELPAGDATGAAIGVMSTLPRDSIFSTGCVLRYANMNNCRLKVWGLRERADHGQQLEWTPIHDKDLEPRLYVLVIQHLTFGWRQSYSYQADAGNSWDEAMDRARGGVVDLEPDEERLHALGYKPWFSSLSSISILGFHPSREVIFFATASSEMVAYDLVSSKLWYLGDATLRNRCVEGVFPYRPCFVDALPLPRSVLNL